MTRAETFYRRLHAALGLTVQDNDTLATVTEAVIMHTLQAGFHCLREQQEREQQRQQELDEVKE